MLLTCIKLLIFVRLTLPKHSFEWEISDVMPGTKEFIDLTEIGHTQFRTQDSGLRKSLRITWSLFLIFAFCILRSELDVFASSGTEDASFLDIPVGAGPAAMGAAYTPPIMPLTISPTAVPSRTVCL